MDPTDPQAPATIEAARIYADAAIRAAWIQAGAALGAIAAGAMAYFGAVRQVWLQERAHEVRALAYRFRLSRIVNEYLAQIGRALAAARRQFETFRDDGGSERIASFRVRRPQTLHDENWEVHALLGRRAVELILVIDETSERLGRFDREIRGSDTKTDSQFESGTLKLVQDGAAGSARYDRETAIVDYVQVLDRLHRALADLKSELARAPQLSPWRRLRRLVPRSGRRRRLTAR